MIRTNSSTLGPAASVPTKSGPTWTVPERDPDMRTQVLYYLVLFESNPMTATSGLRTLLAGNRDAFLDISFTVLSEQGAEPRFLRPLAKFIVSDEAFVDKLEREAAVDLVRVIRVAHHLAGVSQYGFPQSLVRRLNRAEMEGNTGRAGRILALIEGLRDRENVLMPLVPLMKAADARIRSKAILLVGKIRQRQEWLRQALADPDPRVRSNAVESVWGVLSPELCELIRPHVSDPHPRVVANTILALFRAHDPAAPDLLREMVRHKNDRFRASAAWAIGRCGDRQFVPVLIEMLKDKNPHVFRNALRALLHLRNGNR